MFVFCCFCSDGSALARAEHWSSQCGLALKSFERRILTSSNWERQKDFYLVEQDDTI